MFLDIQRSESKITLQFLNNLVHQINHHISVSYKISSANSSIPYVQIKYLLGAYCPINYVYTTNDKMQDKK